MPRLHPDSAEQRGIARSSRRLRWSRAGQRVTLPAATDGNRLVLVVASPNFAATLTAPTAGRFVEQVDTTAQLGDGVGFYKIADAAGTRYVNVGTSPATTTVIRRFSGMPLAVTSVKRRASTAQTARHVASRRPAESPALVGGAQRHTGRAVGGTPTFPNAAASRASSRRYQHGPHTDLSVPDRQPASGSYDRYT